MCSKDDEDKNPYQVAVLESMDQFNDESGCPPNTGFIHYDKVEDFAGSNYGYVSKIQTAYKNFYYERTYLRKEMGRYQSLFEVHSLRILRPYTIDDLNTVYKISRKVMNKE